MALTGIRVGELRNARFKDVQTLFQKQRPFIEIQALKGGPLKKAFLTKEGNLLVKSRAQDFQILCQAQQQNLQALVFSAKGSNETVSREHVTK